MSKIKEIIVASVLPALKEVGKIEMKQVLSGIKEHNDPEIYKNTILSLHINFLLLQEAAVKTKSNIDDGIVNLVLEAVKESAEIDGIILS
jgi:hypothetical protein